MRHICIFFCVVAFVVNTVEAFVQPVSFIQPSQRGHDVAPVSTSTSSMSLGMVPPSETLLSDLYDSISPFLVGDEVSGGGEGAFGLVRNVLLGATAVIFALAGLTILTASYIVPKAAEQLKTDTQRLRPGLWEEYEAKLQPGETITSRPDLLQELGNIMQPIIVADYEAKFTDAAPKQSSAGAEVSPPSPSPSQTKADSEGPIADAEIVADDAAKTSESDKKDK